MAGIKWRFRRIETGYDIDDGMWYAEPIFHRDDNRMGIMDDIYLGWWPFIDKDTTNIVLDKDWYLTGKGGGRVTYLTSWEFPNELHIRPIQPTHPWVEKNDTGPTHFNVEQRPPILVMKSGAQTFKVGPDETQNNGGPNSLENFELSRADMSYDFLITKNSKTMDIEQPGGNGMIWVRNPDPNTNVHVKDVGGIDSSIAIKNKGNQQQTFTNKGKNVIGFHVAAVDAKTANVCRGVGYRSWVNTPDAEKQQLTFSMVLNTYAMAGLNFQTRIGYPGNWQLFNTQIAAGQTHVTFKFNPKKVKPENYGKPLVIDWVYGMYFNFLTFPGNAEIKVELSSLTVHGGWIPTNRLNPAFHASVEENSFAHQYGFSRRKEISYTTFGSVTFDHPLQKDDYRLVISSDKEMRVDEKTRYGFTYQGIDIIEGEEWSFGYSTKVCGDVADII